MPRSFVPRRSARPSASWLALAAAALALAAAPSRAQATLDAPAAPDAPAALGAPGGGAALAAALPAGFYLEDAAGGARFELPTAVAFAPDGRMFVAEKRGVVWVVENGVRRPTPFLDLQAEVLDHHDRGLLGLVLDPAFAQNRRVYIVYTVDHDGTGDRERTDAFARVTRYAASAADPNRADPSTRRVLLGPTFAQGIPACYYSHVPATLAFGRDGTLLVGTGDAANFNRVDAGGLYPNCFGAGRLPASEDIGAFRALRVESLAGKILRIDPETGLGLPSNPFYTGNAADNASRVWAMGVRNPFRFAVAPDGTTNPAQGRPGTVVLGDVGWDRYEELDVARGGESFGWPCREGPEFRTDYGAARPTTNGCGAAPAARAPAAHWNHTFPDRSNPPGLLGRTVVGGAFYGGTRYPPAYRGAFFAGDYANGWMTVSHLSADGELSTPEPFSLDAGPIVDVEYDAATQALHWVDIGAGAVLRLRHVDGGGNQAPVAAAAATPPQGPAPLPVAFSSAGSFDPEGGTLTFRWAFGDGGTSTQPDPAHTYAAAGHYTATLTVADPQGAEATTAVEVAVGQGGAPTVTLLAPTEGRTAQPGETVTLRAAAADPDQPASSLFVRWDVVQVHASHEHPDFLSAEGLETQFVVPQHGTNGELVYYRIRVTVRDDDGLTATAERALRVGAPGEADVTAAGTPIALVTAPTGTGSRSLETIRDGVTPPVGSADPALQYDTYTGDAARADDWVGYAFDGPRRFTRLVFQEGLRFNDGGWFSTLRVEVRQGGVWTPLTSLHVEPAYRGDDGVPFDTYALLFDEAEGDAIRLAGAPGGSARFVSVGELRAFAREAGGALPAGWAAEDVGPVAVPGTTSYGADAFTVGGGGDVWGDADAFRYAYRALEGDGAITARLTSVDGQNPWAKAGLMIRAGLERGAPHAFLLGTPGAGVHFQTRTTAGAYMASTPGPPAAAPVWLRLQRAGDVLTGYASADGLTWAVVGSATVAMGPRVWVGLAVTSTDLDDQPDLATAAFDEVAVEGAAAGLPAPWARADVGPVAVAGTVEYDGGTYTVTGAGDVWGDADAFGFVHQPLHGDGTLTARLGAANGLDPWAKMGLMIRGGLERGAPHAFLLGTPGRGVHLQFRPAAGAPMQNVPGPEVGAPVWLRLVRSGDVFTGYTSADGQTWAPVGSATVTMGPDALFGLAVTSTDYAGRGDAALAAFSGVSVSGPGGVTAPPDAPAVRAAPPFGIERVFPNPSRGAATLRLAVEAPGWYAVEAYDVLGRLVFTSEIREEAPAVRDLPLDLAGRAAGLYVVRVRHRESGRQALRRLTVVN